MDSAVLKLLCSLLFLTTARSLRIHLQDSPEKLEPELEERVFLHKRHQEPGHYRVLREAPGRYGRETAEEDVDNIELALPFQDSEVLLVLQHCNDIAVDGLAMSFQDDSEKTVTVPHFCFYCGTSDDTWAVISTCDQLSGVVDHQGKSYHLEHLEDTGSRNRRDIRGSRYIMIPIESTIYESLGHHNAPPPILPPAPVDALIDHNAWDEREHDDEVLLHRSTRASTPEYIVELAVFVDRSLYRYIKKRYPDDDQDQKTVDIIMTIINAVHRLYLDDSLGKYKIGMLVKKVEVLGSGQPSNGGGDIYKYLKNFCEWQSSKNPKDKQGKWDHAILFSGEDLWNESPSQNTTVGLAYVGGMCSSMTSCTISEGTSFAGAYIAAHEIGHNLNMRHDGEYDSCPGNKYIMAPIMSSGATTWSSCSKTSLSWFLSSRTGKCLQSTYISSRKGHEGKMPGLRFGAQEQCHYMYGEGWDFYESTEDPFNNVCREIWCRKGRRLRTPSAAALDGTPCGSNKICKRSKCKQVVSLNDGNKGKPIKKGNKGAKTKNDSKSKGNAGKKRDKNNKKDKNTSKEKKNKKTGELDFPNNNGKVKKTNKKDNDKDIKNLTGKKLQNKNNKGDKLSSTTGDSTSIRTKSVFKKNGNKIPKKNWKLETETHIILKERLEYIDGKGWKVRVTKIKKPKSMIASKNNGRSGSKKMKQRKRVKTCEGRDPNKCRKVKKKKEKKADIFRILEKPRDRCKLEKVKEEEGKGWWVRLPIDCIIHTSR